MVTSCTLTAFVANQGVASCAGLSFWSFLVFLLNTWLGNLYVLFILFFYLYKPLRLDFIVIFFTMSYAATAYTRYPSKLNFFKFFKKDTIVLELLDGLIEAHPPVFYATTALIFLFITKHLRGAAANLIFFFRSKWALVVTSTLSLFSGGFWSFSQSTWTSWWSWDPVEFVLLVIVILSLAVAHSSFFLHRAVFFTFFYGTVGALFATLAVRLGLIPSRHSFLAQAVAANDFWAYSTLAVLFSTANPATHVTLFYFFLYPSRDIFCKLVAYALPFCINTYTSTNEYTELAAFSDLTSLRDFPAKFVVLLSNFTSLLYVEVVALVLVFYLLYALAPSTIFLLHCGAALVGLVLLVSSDIVYTKFISKEHTSFLLQNSIFFYFRNTLENLNLSIFSFFFDEIAYLYIAHEDFEAAVNQIYFEPEWLKTQSLFYLWAFTSQVLASTVYSGANAFIFYLGELLYPFIEQQEHTNNLTDNCELINAYTASNAFIYDFFNKIVLNNDPWEHPWHYNKDYFLVSPRPGEGPGTVLVMYPGVKIKSQTLTSFFGDFCESYVAEAHKTHAERVMLDIMFYKFENEVEADDFDEYPNYKSTLSSTSFQSTFLSAGKLTRNVDNTYYYFSPVRMVTLAVFSFYFILALLFIFFIYN